MRLAGSLVEGRQGECSRVPGTWARSSPPSPWPLLEAAVDLAGREHLSADTRNTDHDRDDADDEDRAEDVKNESGADHAGDWNRA